jgi:hypothetical protein
MIIVCMTLILTGLAVHVFTYHNETPDQTTVNQILLIALACLLLMPVAVLIILGYGYSKAGNFKMTAWIGALLFFIAFGTYILFLIKML